MFLTAKAVIPLVVVFAAQCWHGKALVGLVEAFLVLRCLLPLESRPKLSGVCFSVVLLVELSSLRRGLSSLGSLHFFGSYGLVYIVWSFWVSRDVL